MSEILNPDGLRQLNSFAGKNCIFAFDYDGTLSPLSPDPMRAPLRPATFALLQQLDGLAPVAIITGRSRADVNQYLPPIRHVIGNHGIETDDADPLQLANAERMTVAWYKQLQGETAFIKGVFLEMKRFSISIHFSHCRPVDEARRQLISIAESLEPKPRIVPGKDVVNVVAANAPHKGNALISLLDKYNFTSALFVGDDVTDEDVFRLFDPRILSVRVGDLSHSSAQYCLAQQAHIDSLLEALIDICSANVT